MEKVKLAKYSSNGLAKKEVSREDIMDFESMLKEQEGAYEGDSAHCPLEHSFSDGIYVRKITIPKGEVIVGKIHKHDHPNFLMEGEVVVMTEQGKETIKAPCSMISKAGTKRVLYAKTELVWVTVHHNPTNTRNLEELEKIVIAQSYEDYDKFIATKDNFIARTKKKLIKLLSKSL